jgi:hypothetical protein
MAASLSGKVAVYGVDGTLAFTGMIKTANILKGGSITQSYREANLEKNGMIIGKAADMLVRQASFSFVPYASDGTPTLAEAKALILFPMPLALITIDDYDIAMFDGDWNCVGSSSVTTREDGYAEITVTGEQVWNGSTFAALAVVA